MPVPPPSSGRGVGAFWSDRLRAAVRLGAAGRLRDVPGGGGRRGVSALAQLGLLVVLADQAEEDGLVPEFLHVLRADGATERVPTTVRTLARAALLGERACRATLDALRDAQLLGITQRAGRPDVLRVRWDSFAGPVVATAVTMTQVTTTAVTVPAHPGPDDRTTPGLMTAHPGPDDRPLLMDSLGSASEDPQGDPPTPASLRSGGGVEEQDEEPVEEQTRPSVAAPQAEEQAEPTDADFAADFEAWIGSRAPVEEQVEPVIEEPPPPPAKKSARKAAERAEQDEVIDRIFAAFVSARAEAMRSAGKAGGVAPQLTADRRAAARKALGANPAEVVERAAISIWSDPWRVQNPGHATFAHAMRQNNVERYGAGYVPEAPRGQGAKVVGLQRPAQPGEHQWQRPQEIVL